MYFYLGTSPATKALSHFTVVSNGTVCAPCLPRNELQRGGEKVFIYRPDRLQGALLQLALLLRKCCVLG